MQKNPSINTVHPAFPLLHNQKSNKQMPQKNKLPLKSNSKPKITKISNTIQLYHHIAHKNSSTHKPTKKTKTEKTINVSHSLKPHFPFQSSAKSNIKDSFTKCIFKLTASLTESRHAA